MTRKNLMAVYDAMSEDDKEIVRNMSDAARCEMREAGVRPLVDDRVAIFDEACAVYLKASKEPR